MDKEIKNLIVEEFNRQTRGIELIASENYVSDVVMEAMGSVLTNKYAEGYPGHRYYGGCEIVDKVETLAIERLKKLFGAEYANVQPHSGSQANMAVIRSCIKPGDTILGLGLSYGGHLTHGSNVSFSGQDYKVVSYCTDSDGYIDYEDLEIKADSYKPKLIIAGASAYSRDWDYQLIRKIADSVGAIFMVDMAHPAGLIAAGLLTNPIDYAHIVTSTTHKTLRGPRGGVILMKQDFINPLGLKDTKGNIKMMSQVIDSTVFPGIQGGPLEHVIAAKAVAFGEALAPEFKTYQTQVVKNAQVMASELKKRGYKVLTGGTDNHSLLVDLRTKFPEMSGKLAEQLLLKVDITTNKNMVPFDNRSPFQTSGIRLGTPAITTRGLKEQDIIWVVDMIDKCLSNSGNEDYMQELKQEINTKMRLYPLFKDHND